MRDLDDTTDVKNHFTPPLFDAPITFEVDGVNDRHIVNVGGGTLRLYNLMHVDRRRAIEVIANDTRLMRSLVCQLFDEADVKAAWGNDRR